MCAGPSLQAVRPVTIIVTLVMNHEFWSLIWINALSCPCVLALPCMRGCDCDHDRDRDLSHETLISMIIHHALSCSACVLALPCRRGRDRDRDRERDFHIPSSRDRDRERGSGRERDRGNRERDSRREVSASCGVCGAMR